MENNIMKDLFNQQRYNEVIGLLRILYSDLYIQMLNYKKNDIEDEYINASYFQLSALIRKYYPQFSDNITLLNVTYDNPDLSYLDVINTMLSTYIYFKENYKKEVDMSKYNDDTTIDEYIEDEEDDFFDSLYDELHKDDVENDDYNEDDNY